MASSVDPIVDAVYNTLVDVEGLTATKGNRTICVLIGPYTRATIIFLSNYAMIVSSETDYIYYADPLFYDKIKGQLLEVLHDVESRRYPLRQLNYDIKR